MLRFRFCVSKYSFKKKKQQAQLVFAMCQLLHALLEPREFSCSIYWPGHIFVFLRGSGLSGFAMYRPKCIQSLQAPPLTVCLVVT